MRYSYPIRYNLVSIESKSIDYLKRFEIRSDNRLAIYWIDSQKYWLIANQNLSKMIRSPNQ